MYDISWCFSIPDVFYDPKPIRLSLAWLRCQMQPQVRSTSLVLGSVCCLCSDRLLGIDHWWNITESLGAPRVDPYKEGKHRVPSACNCPQDELGSWTCRGEEWCSGCNGCSGWSEEWCSDSFYLKAKIQKTLRTSFEELQFHHDWLQVALPVEYKLKNIEVKGSKMTPHNFHVFSCFRRNQVFWCYASFSWKRDTTQARYVWMLTLQLGDRAGEAGVSVRRRREFEAAVLLAHWTLNHWHYADCHMYILFSSVQVCVQHLITTFFDVMSYHIPVMLCRTIT